MRELAVIILAAGKGTRMPGELPKVLHPVAGEPLLAHVLRTARALRPARILLVLGYRADEVRAHVDGSDTVVVLQETQRGTGDAVRRAEPELRDFAGDLLVLYGDVPLLSPDSLRALLETHGTEENVGTILTAELTDPAGYGRIVRDDTGRVRAIREHADLRAGEAQIREINSGIMAFDCGRLLAALQQIAPNNRQGEYYLTDVVEIMEGAGGRIGAHRLAEPQEILGVNTVQQLAEVERIFAARKVGGNGSCPRCTAAGISRESRILVEGDHGCLAVEDPGFNSGHLVVYPRRHITQLLSASPEELHVIGDLLRRGEDALRRVYRFDGLNIGFSSGSRAHFAVQLIPRWTGDMSFLPLVAGLKPVPESPGDAWQRLHEVMS